MLDLMITKNVMVYVNDPLEIFREFRRVLKPGGKVHAIDRDFAMVAIDPVPPKDWRGLLDAAAHAFRTAISTESSIALRARQVLRPST